MIEHLQTILSFSVRQGNMTQLRDSEDWRFTLCGPFLWWQWKGPGRQLQRSGGTTTAQIRTICILPSAFHVVYIAHTLSLSLLFIFWHPRHFYMTVKKTYHWKSLGLGRYVFGEQILTFPCNVFWCCPCTWFWQVMLCISNPVNCVTFMLLIGESRYCHTILTKKCHVFHT